MSEMKNTEVLALAVERKDVLAMKGAIVAMLYQEFDPKDEEGQGLRAFCMKFLYHADPEGLSNLILSILTDDDQSELIANAVEQWRAAWNRNVPS